MSGPIQVLVVEDSPSVRELIVEILNADPHLQVVGTASDGVQAIEMVKRKKPHVITMDLHMPNMDGVEAVRIIMETCPTPIVIVSANSVTGEVEETFRALEAGALALVEKPVNFSHTNAKDIAEKLRQTVKLMSEVKVVRRWSKTISKTYPSLSQNSPLKNKSSARAIKLIAIGASTGGPLVLQTILAGLAEKLNVPVLIVQHMAKGFTEGFADWLSQSTRIKVTLAKQGEHLLPGRAYIAPESHHLEIRSGMYVYLSNALPENGHQPSVAPMFRSVAKVLGNNAIGILLTGMGKDGAEALKIMRDVGALTIVQDPETAVVPGMPGEAVRLEAATHILAPEKIPSLVIDMLGV